MHAAFLNSFTHLNQRGVETPHNFQYKSKIIAQFWNRKGENPLLHPISDHIREGSCQKIILICIIEEKWHIIMDTEMEYCQGDSKGLKKNQTADKLLKILPKESQTLCEIQSLAMSC